MIHFKLISATDLSKFACTSYVKIIPQMDGVNNSEPYSITEKVSKKKEPVYNHEIEIPFYCLNSLDLIFFQKKLGKEKSIGIAKIPFTLDTFLLPQPQITDIKLYEPFKDSCPTVKFSVSYFPISYLYINPVVNPKRVFVYLTYDPPLQPNTQEVDLICKGVDDNGTIYDPSISTYILREKVPARCGPTGLTQVYYFDHEKIKEGKFFFYIKSVSYTGKVTLNFCTSPEKVNTENHKEYFMIDNPHSIYVNHKQTVFILFPIKFLFSIESVSISQIEMLPVECIVQPNPNIQSVENPTGDEFIKLYNYFTSDPDGIAEWSIIYSGSLSLLFSNDRINSYRFEIEGGNKYSLTNAFKLNRIFEIPREIYFAMNYRATGSNLYFHVLSCSDKGQNISSFKVNDKSTTSEKPVYFKFIDNYQDNKSLPGVGAFTSKENFMDLLKKDANQNDNDLSIDKKRICINLEKIEKSVRFIAIIASSGNKASSNKNGGLVFKQIWDDASCRVVDSFSRKEVMCLKLKQHVCPCGIFIALLFRTNDDNWEVWPCNQLFKSNLPYSTSLPDSEKNAIENFSTFFTKGEINELFGI